MAIFGNPKFIELEEKYQKGIQYTNEVHSFKLTLKKKIPSLTNIHDYYWIVTLSDGYELYAPMGPKYITFPNTRLEVIIYRLKKVNRYQDDFLANAINDKIDEVYREYSLQ